MIAGAVAACAASACAGVSGLGAGRGADDAPEESGRAILERACTGCHDLGGLEAFKGYYDAEQWRDLVVTMVEHGAEIEDRQIDVLVDHLAEAYGSRSR